MARKLRHSDLPARDVKRVEIAIECLRQARELLKYAGAKRTADKVRIALNSAAGAKRHAERIRFNAGEGR